MAVSFLQRPAIDTSLKRKRRTGRFLRLRFRLVSQSGLTLLELILALSLSSLLLMAVAMALSLYWKAFDVRRTNVEQSQLARALLQHMAADISAAQQYTPPDLSGLESMTGIAGDAAGALLSGAAGSGGSGSTGQQGAGSQGGSTGSQQGNQSSGGDPNSQSSQSTNSSGDGNSSGGGASPGSGAANSSGASSGNSSSGSGASGNAASGSQQSGSGSTPTAAEDSAAAGSAVVLGLYGSAGELQFDISKLPRVDQYQTLNSGSGAATEIPSDIKTVTYYVRSEQSENATNVSGSQLTGGEPSTSGRGRGLMRLELDRAVKAYEESNGTVSAGYDSARLLADEVTSVQFQYWDGAAWATEWDSDEMGGLPIAIEIILTMVDPSADPASVSAEEATTSETGVTTYTGEKSYRFVVHLPSANPTGPMEEMPAEEETGGQSSASGTQNSASGAQSSGGSTPGSSSTKSGGTP